MSEFVIIPSSSQSQARHGSGPARYALPVAGRSTRHHNGPRRVTLECESPHERPMLTEREDSHAIRTTTLLRLTRAIGDVLWHSTRATFFIQRGGRRCSWGSQGQVRGVRSEEEKRGATPQVDLPFSRVVTVGNVVGGLMRAYNTKGKESNNV